MNDDAPGLINLFPAQFWYSWRHQMREFSADYYVVAIDQRGYGVSNRERESEREREREIERDREREGGEGEGKKGELGIDI